jgi:putative oxidoreductase
MSRFGSNLAQDGLGFSARALLVVVFAWACIHKIVDPGDFGLQVATYQILPFYLVNVFALVLPWLELVAAGLLALGLWTRAAALTTCGMNLVFIVAVALALRADLQLGCGCFASSQAGEQMTVELIWRDIGLLAVGLFLVLKRPDRLTLDHWLAKKV